jgi:MtN3 and saliva related transmembrane protein
VSVGYFAILLIGFLLWICYGSAAGILALVIPNTVALLAGAAVIIVALRLRRRAASGSSQPADPRARR